ncbi:MAG TPA: tripartite tricarboxylate transporter substrate binding protein [Burkholderiales bacterium]|nr:tripartite tricarboxylate transporter substrate binding protein [Burkholderiales bacterium]
MLRAGFGVIGAVCAALAGAAEHAYPLRPVRMIVSATPGGTVDLVARVLAPKLSNQLGQQFIVDNRSGAGGVVAAELIARAVPDGYTLGVVYTSFTTNAALRKHSSYDPVSDYAPISLVMWTPLVLIANPALAVSSVRELIAMSKTRELHYASSGNGSGGHMCGELFKSLAGIRSTHVPYKGAALGTNDVVSGEVQYAFVGPVTVTSLVRAGRLRLLGVTSLKRNASMPEIPTLDEQGVTGFEVMNWFGIVAPPRLPRVLAAQLNREVVQVLVPADVRQKLGGEGAEIVGSTPEAFGGFLKRDVDKWRKVVAAARITLD